MWCSIQIGLLQVSIATTHRFVHAVSMAFAMVKYKPTSLFSWIRVTSSRLNLDPDLDHGACVNKSYGS